MPFKAAQRTSKLKPSVTLAISARANELRAAGEDVLNLSVGEPDFKAPEHMRAAAIKAIEEGNNHYTPPDGSADMKKAIIDKLKRENHLDYEAAQIIASTGEKQALFNFFLAVINPGDEVIIPAPYWVSYPAMVEVAEGVPVSVYAGPDQHYKVTADQIEKAITDKTRAIIINSPSNPTGAVYSQDELKTIADVLLKHPNILIVSDDIYEHIRWSAGDYVNIVNVCPELYDRTVVFNGISKAFAATGWRLGYAAGPADIIKPMKTIQSQSTSNPCSIIQIAATAGLNGGHDCIDDMLNIFKERYAYFHQALNEIPGFHAPDCEGAFYIFPDVSSVIEKTDGVSNDVEFAEYILNEAKIACVPGTAFGSPGCIRFSYATGMDTLKEAIARLQKLF